MKKFTCLGMCSKWFLAKQVIPQHQLLPKTDSRINGIELPSILELKLLPHIYISNMFREGKGRIFGPLAFVTFHQMC